MTSSETLHLLFEIGAEELPPLEIPAALAALEAHVRSAATAARLPIDGVKTYATPRRLALTIRAVAPFAETTVETVTGPPARASFDADGNLTAAAIGFARGRGIDPATLERVATPKGEYVGATVRREGDPADVILTRALNESFAAIPWRRSMRWGWSEVSFARPVHWIVATLGGAVLDVSFGDISAGSVTRGHRFMAPTPLPLLASPVPDLDPAEDATLPIRYVERLRRAKVMVDVDERRDAILAGVAAAAAAAGVHAIADSELADEVKHLVEWPVALAGRFPTELLDVPREVLVTSMRSHQRYFATEDAAGNLANVFILIANMEVPDPDVVIHGNLRVLLARLEDAKFFYREDRKHPLDERVQRLASIRYIDKLGSVLDRTRRIVRLAGRLAAVLYPDDAETLAAAERAAYLCKADLTTGMVGEFPTLQGTMGRYYALLSGEPQPVAVAIEEHYAPRGASDAPPTSPAGIVVSLADKLDALAGCFSLGLVPTGSADPYALRRAALGIVRTAIERGLRFDVHSMLRFATSGLPEAAVAADDRAAVAARAFEFVESRLRALLATDAPTDIADAVVAVIGDDLPSARRRVAVLAQVRRDEDFLALAAAFKRAVNILRKATDEDPSLAETLRGSVDDSLLETPAERALAEAVANVVPEVDAALALHDFELLANRLAGLKPSIDRFFDDVMVNVEDPQVRRNRLELLVQVRTTFLRFADISRIQVDGR